MDFDQALQTFIMESRELLAAMEESLLGLEASPNDPDAIGAIFRAAHTIKGSGGMFGLDTIVAFTHIVENVLDRVRGGMVQVDGELVALLLSCRDHIGVLVEQIAADAATPPETLNVGALLLDRLKAYQAASKSPVLAIPQSKTTVLPRGEVESDLWHISLRFSQDVLRYGMDPLSFIRYLAKMGKIVHIVTLPDAMPPAAKMEPESCYLGFEIDFHGEGVDKAAIEKVFEFVRDDCTLRILPPHSHIDDYISLINELPEDKIRLGELLVNSGSLTRNELDEALYLQEKCAEFRQETRHLLDKPACQLGQILVEQGMVQPELVDAALVKQKAAKEHKALESTLIRIQAAKLDHLINLVGELVIAGASTNLLVQRTKDAVLLESTSILSRLVEEIRDSALQLRMVQIGETFSRFNRVVRDTSLEIGKDIGLSILGAETELDKSVVEKIGDPLMHLVRNSMDHGIEKASLRRERGKPEKGTVFLNAYHESGSIVIEVGDDGGGLNKERILAKALEKGLISASQTLSDQEVYMLIFEAGFSTSETVTNLSGRGVGMDVVRRNIEALRGTVQIDSREGLGATVKIRLPLTLAIIDGFLMRVGKASYVVPLDLVMECVELSEAERRATLACSYFDLRGTVLPFIRLRDHFREKSKPGRIENIVVVQYAGQKSGLVVDELMGEFQAVIKPLGRLFGNIEGIGGSTILGSGEVALILDVPALIKSVE